MVNVIKNILRPGLSEDLEGIKRSMGCRDLRELSEGVEEERDFSERAYKVPEINPTCGADFGLGLDDLVSESSEPSKNIDNASAASEDPHTDCTNVQEVPTVAVDLPAEELGEMAESLESIQNATIYAADPDPQCDMFADLQGILKTVQPALPEDNLINQILRKHSETLPFEPEMPYTFVNRRLAEDENAVNATSFGCFILFIAFFFIVFKCFFRRSSAPAVNKADTASEETQVADEAPEWV